MALFSLTGRSGVRNSIPMLARIQRASEYLHKGMDQPPNGPYGKCRAVQGEAAEVPTCNPWGVSRLSWYFACVVINFFETSHIGSMNMNRTCSRPCRYDAGMTACRPSSDIEKDGPKVRQGGVTDFVACCSPGGKP
jgi:hypothetical protein